MENNDKDSIKGYNTVTRIISILKSLEEDINTVTGIAVNCGINKTTVHRLLNTMEAAGLVIYDSVLHRYYVGPTVNQLISHPRITHEFLISCSVNEMKRIFELSQETVILDILIGYHHVLLHEIPSEHILKVTEGKPGTKAILSVGATSKVLLSQFQETDLQNVIKDIEDRSLIHPSETDQDLLLNELRRIRKEGYAVTYGERVAGIIGISAPIKNYMFPVAIGILGPDSRLIMNVSKLVTEIVESANRISHKIEDALQAKHSGN